MPITPLPKRSAHRPLTLIGLPSLFFSVPWKAPVRGSKALIAPSPKLPTSRSPLNGPKCRGATARPQGAFRGPCETSRRSRWPLVSKTST